MALAEPARVLLTVSQLAAEAVAEVYYAQARQKPIGKLLPNQRELWVIGRNGEPEDPIMLRHWALKIQDRYFELARVVEDNSVVFEANAIDEPHREINQINMMGYTHYSEDEILQWVRNSMFTSVSIADAFLPRSRNCERAEGI